MTYKADFLLKLFALSLSLLIMPNFACAQDIKLEDRVKAAFLYKFCYYITWPDDAFDSPSSPIEIAVIGDDNIAQELQRVTQGRDIAGRPLTIKAYSFDTLPEQIHLLFIGRNTAPNNSDWLNMIRHRPMLIVSDKVNGLDQGSAINFLIDNQRVRFDISLTSLKSHQLEVGSQLLSVARDVRGADQ